MDVKQLEEIERRLAKAIYPEELSISDVDALVAEVRALRERIGRLERYFLAEKWNQELEEDAVIIYMGLRHDKAAAEELMAIVRNAREEFNDALAALDADESKEPAPVLVPVYPGPDLKRGDFVYTPDGRRAEVYNISEDAGTFTSQGQFCATVLRRERTDADEKGEE